MTPAQVNQVTQHVELLRRTNPELDQDEVLKLDMIEGETDAIELLKAIEAERREACLFAAGVASVISELDERLGRYERREKRLRELIHKVMDACDLRKIELPTATLSIRPCPPKVLITTDIITELPPEYIRVKHEPDKAKILAALKSGATVSGAALGNQPDTLSIRTK